MFTNRAKALGVTVLAVVVVGGLSYANYTNSKEIAKLESIPVVITKTVIVTPTVNPGQPDFSITPTAGQAGALKFVPRASSAAATKGVK